MTSACVPETLSVPEPAGRRAQSAPRPGLNRPETYAISGDELDSLVAAGGKADQEAVDLYTFTSVLKRQHQLFTALLVVTDALVIAVATMAALLLAVWAIPEAWKPIQWESWLKESLLLFTVPTGIIALWYCGMYRPRRDRSR